MTAVQKYNKGLLGVNGPVTDSWAGFGLVWAGLGVLHYAVLIV